MKSEPFVIEKNIPIPAAYTGVRLKYPFGEMKIGDSFRVQGDAALVAKVRYAACYFGLRHVGYRFSIRQEDGGCRVWRIADIR